MVTTIKIAGAALLGLGLVACAPVAHNYGEAHAYNKYAHAVDPSPTYDEDDAAPGDSGERGESAARAYREGNVKQPSRGRSGGGGGGGGLGGANGPR